MRNSSSDLNADVRPGRCAAVRHRALAGVSIVALMAASQHPGVAHAGEEYLSGTTVISDQIYSGESVVGGTGSGGGAGLGGAIFIGAGATVIINNTDFIGNTATGGIGGVGDTGGGLNGRGDGTAGATGQDGGDAPGGFAYVSGGNGGAGSTGFPGGAGSGGVGGTGGMGGDGSSGSVTTADIVKSALEQAKAIFDAAGESTEAGLYTAIAAELLAASGAANATVPPNAALSAALATAAASFTSLAAEATASAAEESIKAIYEAAYLTAIQITSYELGAAGAGGDGGKGGAGGTGSFGYGGGAGGDGGDGGDAVSGSGATGGKGGDGGKGGAGGFGAGGGKGGDGGDDGADGSSAQNGPDGGAGGAGGTAGFGGGVGSTADGSENGINGGGGSGYGGAIFVQSGGSVTLTGNITFSGNSVFGGSSENGGVAGQAAGTDLFMMKGSNVTLNAGTGNVITFNGTIADDSKASIAGTSIASGQGAGLTVQSGLVVFNGTNTYTGQTKIEGGVLQAVDGVGIHKDSNINLAGGVLQSSGTFDRYLGTAPDRIQWAGSGGFAAAGGDLTVSINGGAGLTWGSGSFVPIGSTLLFGSDSADSDVHFMNAINLAGGTRTIVANGGAENENLVYLKGVISNGSLVLGDGTTEGTIAMTAANTYTGSTTVHEGTTLLLQGAAALNASSEVNIEGALDISGLTGNASIVTLSGDGTVSLGDKTLTVTNGSTTFAGTIDGAGNFIIAGGTQTLSGENTYTGKTTVNAAATLALIGTGSIADSSEVQADGTFDISGTSAGAEIVTLSGSGNVALGAQTLTITDASTEFSGVIGGTGGLTIEDGELTLSGNNTYSGATLIEDDATLVLKGAGAIASSSSVTADGIFDIAETNSGASIVTLAGAGSVLLGEETLTITNGSTTFAGIIEGEGGVAVSGGTQTLAGANTYTGDTDIATGATLALTGGGTIADSAKVTVDGTFDIADADDDIEIVTLAGNGVVTLGDNSITLTDASTGFAGAIGGAGGLTIAAGELTLSGVNGYTGATEIAEDVKLFLTGSGAIASSESVDVKGTFDIAGTTSGASIVTLLGDGLVALGDKLLTVTNASTTFSGTIQGTAGFAVSGGTQTLDGATVSTGLIARDGGSIVVTDSEIDATAMPVLSIVNGGSITTTDTSLTGTSTAFADFDEAGKIATFYLGEGTAIVDNEGTLLFVTRTGAGSDGIVYLTLNTGGVVEGDIFDQDTKTGGGKTVVTLNEGTAWSGTVEVADFLIEEGASATFGTGSTVGNLTAESGAEISIISGNLNILGNLDLNGIISPGNSPGVINVGGNLNSLSDADSFFEVTFGLANPLPGPDGDYDQLNIGGDVNGTLPVRLGRWDSTQQTPLGNLAAIELIKVGGDEFDGFVLGERFVQHGHEILLNRYTRAADDSIIVVNSFGDQNEVEFFGDGDIIVYGLRSIIQDETYGLAALTGTAHQAGRNILGTWVDRRGPGVVADGAQHWMRGGVVRTEVDNTVSSTQTVAYGQFGIDLVSAGEFRAGLLGSYGNSQSDVVTETGIARLGGNEWAGGMHASYSGAAGYIEAIGQYGFSDWTFNPTAASPLTVDGHTATASVEAGLAIGTESARFVPWAQAVYQSTTFNDVNSAWVEQVSFPDTASLLLRGGVRAEGRFGGFSPYAGVAVAHDVFDEKYVVVDGFEFGTGMGATRLEVAAGFQAAMAQNMRLFGDVKGTFGVETGNVTGYEGSAGIRTSW